MNDHATPSETTEGHGHAHGPLAKMMVGAIGIVSSLRFLQLPKEAGAEVSGHRKFQKS